MKSTLMYRPLVPPPDVLELCTCRKVVFKVMTAGCERSRLTPHQMRLCCSGVISLPNIL
jgi:hypothetical protein